MLRVDLAVLVPTEKTAGELRTGGSLAGFLSSDLRSAMRRRYLSHAYH